MAPEVMKHDGYESKSDIWYDNLVIVNTKIDFRILC